MESMRARILIASLLLILLLPQQIASQSTAPHQRPAPSQAAAATCADNGTYVNSKGEMVRREKSAQRRRRGRRHGAEMEPTALVGAEEGHARIMGASRAGYKRASHRSATWDPAFGWPY
jgi:hypothetical protein